MQIAMEFKEAGTSDAHGVSFFTSFKKRLQKEFAPAADRPKQTKMLNLLAITLPFSVPAILYCINNNLGMAIQLEMDPATYQVNIPWSNHR